MGAIQDLLGKKYGKLTVIYLTTSARGRRAWGCHCSCGNRIVVETGRLNSGRVNSCGCRQLESATKHGLYKTPEYKVWANMKYRCDTETAHNWKDYGGRGITYDPRWKKFEAFLDDMGYKPTPEHTIERVDVNGNYTKDNCIWALNDIQQLNRRDTVKHEYNGQLLTAGQIAKLTGIKESTLKSRIRDMNITAEEAVALGVPDPQAIMVNGKLYTYQDLSNVTGISPESYRSRKVRGWDDERIISTPFKNHEDKFVDVRKMLR